MQKLYVCGFFLQTLNLCFARCEKHNFCSCIRLLVCVCVCMRSCWAIIIKCNNPLFHTSTSLFRSDMPLYDYDPQKNIYKNVQTTTKIVSNSTDEYRCKISCEKFILLKSIFYTIIIGSDFVIFENYRLKSI